jgi:hypothetical protein
MLISIVCCLFAAIMCSKIKVVSSYFCLSLLCILILVENIRMYFTCQWNLSCLIRAVVTTPCSWT